MIEASGRAKGSVLSQVLDRNLRESFCGIFDEISKDRLIVVANYEDLLYFCDFCDCTEAMLNDRMPGNLEKWLFIDQSPGPCQ